MITLGLVFLEIAFQPRGDSDVTTEIPFILTGYFALIYWLVPSLGCLVCWLLMLCSDKVPSCAAQTSTCFILHFTRTFSFVWHVLIFCFNFVMLIYWDSRAVFVWLSVLYGVVFGPLELLAWYFGAQAMRQLDPELASKTGIGKLLYPLKCY